MYFIEIKEEVGIGYWELGRVKLTNDKWAIDKA